MKTFSSMTKRNVKIFFKDKAMFFTSLITPIILLVLFRYETLLPLFKRRSGGVKIIIWKRIAKSM